MNGALGSNFSKTNHDGSLNLAGGPNLLGEDATIILRGSASADHPGSIDFWTASRERVRINSTGKVFVAGDGGVEAFIGSGNFRVYYAPEENNYAMAVSAPTPFTCIQFVTGGSEAGTISSPSTVKVIYGSQTVRSTDVGPVVSSFDSGGLLDGITVYDMPDGDVQLASDQLATIFPYVVTPLISSPTSPEQVGGHVDYSQLVPVIVRELQGLRARLAAGGL
jgi:hypothetical protein